MNSVSDWICRLIGWQKSLLLDSTSAKRRWITREKMGGLIRIRNIFFWLVPSTRLCRDQRSILSFPTLQKGSLSGYVQVHAHQTRCRCMHECWLQASNPGQFDNGEPEAHWQKGQTANSLFYPGIVGIGTDRPNATLTVAGDISYTGQLYHPSDRRLKENIREVYH